MPRASIRHAALAATLAASLAGYLTAVAPASATARTPARPAASPGGGGTAAGLLLLNGDHAVIGSAAGGQAVRLLPAPGVTGPVAAMHAGGTTLILPVAAMPFLGRGLGPSLFEVSALSRAERGGRLPVVLRYTGQPHTLPGITLTHRGAGTAQGYLTAASAPAFGAALARQALADHARDSYGRDGLFAGGLSISLPGAPATARAAPAFPMHTLTVRGSNTAGQPDTGDEVTVWDVTDFAKFGDLYENFSSFYHGTARFSVPAGTYWAFGLFAGKTGVRLDILPQFTVRGDTTVSASARAASSVLTIVTPRPTTGGPATFNLRRGSTSGGAISWGFINMGRSFQVNPVSHPPTIGFMYSNTTAQRVSPAAAAIPYAYALDFPAPPGTIRPQRFVVHPGDLAAVHERYYQDAPQSGGWISVGGTAQQFRTSGVGGTSSPVHLPGMQTLYLSARPAMFWQTSYFVPGISSGQTSSWRLFHGGQRLTENWNAYPLHVAPNVSLRGSIFAVVPSASRAKNTLLLDITPFSDSTFGHTGAGFSDNGGPPSGTSGSYALYQNGAKLASGTARQSFSGDLFVQAPVSAQRSQLKFVMTAARKGKAPNLSSASRDVWTWPSRPRPGAVVPAPWYCGASLVGHQVVFDRHCAIQDLLMLRYRLAGLSLAGTAPAGHQVLAISVAHLQHGAQFPITGATAQVSRDGGATWQDATLTRTGPHQFSAGYTAPAGALVSLRVAARDSLGATITETLLDAYQTAS